MQHERRPCGEKSLPSFWGKKGGILKCLSFVGVQRRVIPSTRAFARTPRFDAARPLGRLVVFGRRRRAKARRRRREHEQHRATESSLAIGKRKEIIVGNNKKWKRWRTTRGDDATRTTKIRRRASDAETSHRYVIGGERPIDGGDEDDENVFVE